MNKDKVNLNKKMDDAFHYLALNLNKTGNNNKPVLLHSFRVAELLYKLDYSDDVIIAGILHDLIEDTDITYNDILEKYNKKIADIVLAVSFNPSIEDYIEKQKEMFNKCIEYGNDALFVKCSDLIDNIDYVVFEEDIEKRKKLILKYDIFLDITKDLIGNTKLYNILADKYNEVESCI